MSTFLAAFVVFAAIGIVSWPLFRRIGSKTAPGFFEDTEVSELLTQKDATLFAINELESDYEIGSLSQGDYQELRGKYEEKAVALIKTVDELRSGRGLDAASDIDDEIEARVLSLRAARSTTEQDIEARVLNLRSTKKVTPDGKACPGCGAQLQPDAVFCSRCGVTLSMKCPGCSAQVRAGDLFCLRCGMALSNTGKHEVTN
ncbi:MAG: zinc ribbon domain-containing protein [Dehalococcoidales bacterium]|nr:zinc ribbon domain-containing protein [Dehalococcoidales bacterium]